MLRKSNIKNQMIIEKHLKRIDDFRNTMKIKQEMQINQKFYIMKM